MISKGNHVKFARFVLFAGREGATSDRVVQNPPCWRASSLLFPHWDIKTKKPEPVKLEFAFVLMSQCGNNNELALQHGGFCTT